MKIENTKDALILSGFEEFIARILNQITLCSDAEAGSKAAERLYSNPSEEAELNADWKEYVHPDLKQLFESANDVVNGDLAGIQQTSKGEKPEFALRIPLSHAESWLSSLNQARLALAADFDIAETDMGSGPKTISTERELAIFQIDLYAFLQECLVQRMTNDFEL